MIDNGGIEIAIYCRKEKAALRITDHKIVRFYGEDIIYIDAFEEGLKKIGFVELKKQRILSHKFHHYHFYPRVSLSPDCLKQQLESDNFRKVDEIEEENG